MKGIGKIGITLVTVLLLGLAAACAPAAKPASPGEVPPSPAQVTAPEQVAPSPTAQSTTVEWGIIEIRVTDPPPADVKSAVVYLTNIEVHRVSGNTSDNSSDNSSDNASGWISIIGAPSSFDLMAVIGIEQILGSANITAGKYTQIRMDVDRVEVVTVDGDNFTAEVPSGELKIVRPFNVEAGGKTVLTLDFDGEKSLIREGNGKFLFKPVVKLLIDGKGEEK